MTREVRAKRIYELVSKYQTLTPTGLALEGMYFIEQIDKLCVNADDRWYAKMQLKLAGIILDLRFNK